MVNDYRRLVCLFSPPFEVRLVFLLAMKLAVTVVGAFIVNIHFPLPTHPPPDHPANVEPLPGEAVSVATMPVLYVPVQSEPQFMPAGEEVTVPAPVPPLFTVRVHCGRVDVVLLTSLEYLLSFPAVSYAVVAK